jgi:hypothetical protein
VRFVPYDDLGDTPNVIVDGSATRSTRLVLSHWPGSETPVELRADLSAEIALNALENPSFLGESGNMIEAASNNHFDQDGLMGVFALVDPAAAMARRDRVVDVARAGDFGWFVDRDSARIAMAIANAFDDYTDALPRVVELLDHPERWRDAWADEDAHLSASLDAIADGTVTIEEHPEFDLAVVTVPDDWTVRATHRFTQDRADAIHPMAINQSTQRLRVLTCQGRRYALEFRYETWVMFVSRPVLLRPDARTLVPILDELEAGASRWKADGPNVLTPTLRSGGESSIDAAGLVSVLLRWLSAAPVAFDPFAG